MKDDIPPAIRTAVYSRDGHRCRFCGVTNAYSYGCHHIKYRSQGGPHTVDNLVLLCESCHRLVHSDKGTYQPLLQELVQLPPNAIGTALMRLKAFERTKAS